MGPGTLHGSIKRMLGAGLVEETRAENPRVHSVNPMGCSYSTAMLNVTFANTQ